MGGIALKITITYIVKRLIFNFILGISLYSIAATEKKDIESDISYFCEINK